MTVIVVTYDPVVAARADRTVTLIDGRLDPNRHPAPTGQVS
jgi:predicted ABC-type transport system involved in lysophospholipase L1 biosynthesis ATPase subunit